MDEMSLNQGALRKEANATTEMESNARNRGVLHAIEHTALTIKKNYKGFQEYWKSILDRLILSKVYGIIPIGKKIR